MANHSGTILRIDSTATSYNNFACSGLNREQRCMVEMMVVIFQLGARVLQLHRPIKDFLSLSSLWRQPHALQRMGDRFCKLIAGPVHDGETHQPVFLMIETDSHL